MNKNTINKIELIENSDINLENALDIFLDNKWKIALCTLSLAIAGALYSTIATPIYQSDTLIQVEQSSTNVNSPLSELNALFDTQSAATAEIEILRSRMIVGEAVNQLNLSTTIEPNYLPVIGPWLAKRAISLSNPGILGLGGYIHGTENISLRKIEIPINLEGKQLIITKTKDGYTIKKDNEVIAKGKENEEAEIKFENQIGSIVIEKLDAKPGAEFFLKKDSNLKTTQDLQQDLGITEKGKQTGIINITLNGENPTKNRLILKTIGDLYVKQNIQRKAAEAEKTLVFLEGFLPELKKQIEDSEINYTNFRDKNKTFDLTTEGKAALDTAVDLQIKLLELQQKRRELSPQFTSAHPAIKTVDQQIAAIKKEIKNIEEKTRSMPGLEQQLLSLTRDVKVNSELYVNLLNSAQQLRLIKEGRVGNVRIIDVAATKEEPISPNLPLNILIGTILGFITGVAFSILKNKLKPEIKDPMEIEQSTGKNVVSVIPRSENQNEIYKNLKNKTKNINILAEKFSSDHAVESLRSLRTTIQFSLIEAKNNIIVLTGSTPGIGKSFISSNLAAILAKSDKKVLLVDGDLRKGYLNQYFGLERENGLSESISNNMPLETYIHKEVLPNLDFLSSGQFPTNPGEILNSNILKNALFNIMPNYDLVIIDTPPVLAVSDALSLTAYAGIVYLISRYKVTTIGEIEESIKRIEQVGGEVNGVIFNDLIPTQRKYGTRYGNYRYQTYEYQ